MSSGGWGPVPVLFDMDGTLVDSRPGIVAALNATLRELGEPEQPEAALVPRIGPPIHDTWAELLRRPADAVGDVVVAYRARYATTMLEGTSVYPGVERLLEQLSAEGHLMAVATSKAQPIAVALLEHLGLDGFFAAIRGPVPPSTEGKPATVGRALEALGLTSGAGAVLVGDRHHDVAGGHAHGLRVIGAGWGYGTRGELEAAGAEAIAAEPLGVGPLLQGLART
ncbi:MAG: HAD hydrolase-like protein [Actinomycetota bacterium]|nr:HAD hydrolase-like protein [Actinomycetota bacterium]